ncbi:hypothetical protein FOXYSP1_01433 [Fusarium oxysporum f. sp. phaseoli]
MNRFWIYPPKLLIIAGFINSLVMMFVVPEKVIQATVAAFHFGSLGSSEG